MRLAIAKKRSRGQFDVIVEAYEKKVRGDSWIADTVPVLRLTGRSNESDVGLGSQGGATVDTNAAVATGHRKAFCCRFL